MPREPSAAAIEAASEAQWNYECEEDYVTRLGLSFPPWTDISETDRAQQRANIAVTLRAAYAVDAL